VHAGQEQVAVPPHRGQVERLETEKVGEVEQHVHFGVVLRVGGVVIRGGAVPAERGATVVQHFLAVRDVHETVVNALAALVGKLIVVDVGERPFDCVGEHGEWGVYRKVVVARPFVHGLPEIVVRRNVPSGAKADITTVPAVYEIDDVLPPSCSERRELVVGIASRVHKYL